MRLLRAKAGELELLAKSNLSYAHRDSPVTEEHVGHLTADIALIASLLADHIEDLLGMGDLSIDVESINPLGVSVPGESPISEWHAGDPPGPGQPGDASDANMSTESLDSQIERLAKWIIENIPGEPSMSEGAVDCAIRIMGLQKQAINGAVKLTVAQVEEIDWLKAEQENVCLAYIEASNPGIDMDEVRRTRAISREGS